MLIALMDETRRTRLCEVEEEPEPRLVLCYDGFDYTYERRENQPNGVWTYYLVDAEVSLGMGSTL